MIYKVPKEVLWYAFRIFLYFELQDSILVRHCSSTRKYLLHSPHCIKYVRELFFYHIYYLCNTKVYFRCMSLLALFRLIWDSLVEDYELIIFMEYPGFQVKVVTSDKYVKCDDGLIYLDLQVGQGDCPKDGQQVFHSLHPLLDCLLSYVN